MYWLNLIKALHVVFVVAWFAGLFYLPRLFVYHAEASEPAVREQLKVMERRLMVMTHIGGALALLFGVWTLALMPTFLRAPWMHAKVGLVELVVL